MVTKRKNNAEITKPFFHDPGIVVVYELAFGSDMIRPGTKLNLVGRRGQFTFTRLVENHTKDLKWIDCISDSTGEWVSVYPSKIKRIVYKRSYAKKK